eukprot:8019647-Karenia_brevis.AAC.1
MYGDRTSGPMYAYGAKAKMQREEAISVVLMNQHRCKRAKLSYMCNFYDIKNAFYAISYADIATHWYHGCKSELCKELYVQLIENHISAKA